MTTTDSRRRTAAGVLDACRGQVEPALRSAVDTLSPPVRHITGYHLGWWDEDQQPTDAGGKAIRPALTVACADAVGGCAEMTVPAAVAVELVHNFSLLHDDVMDRDLTRRHRPTAWAVFGTGPAILTGDALLTLAMDVLAQVGGDVRTLSAVVQELVDGQIADLDFERRSDVGLPECLAMAEAKTGALLGGACALGAAAGGGSGNQVRALDRFGRDIGLAFQLVDDLLGIWGDPAVTGKPVRADLRCRKKSLPVVSALMSGTAEGAELDALYRSPDELSEAELCRAADLVEAAGGRVWARERADDLLADALAALDAAVPGAEDLRVLAHLMARRDR